MQKQVQNYHLLQKKKIRKSVLGSKNSHFNIGKFVCIWNTDDIFIGNFKTYKEAVSRVGISRKTISKYHKAKIPYYAKNTLLGFLFVDP